MKERLTQIISQFAGKRVLVLGDVMLDKYIWGRVSRISPEAPVPIVEVEREECIPGGAANVANNIAALGGVALLCGVIGDDAPGQKLRSLFSSNGIVAEGLVVDGRRPTTLKTRIVAHNQHVVRVDHETKEAIHEDTRKSLEQYVLGCLETADACLISDYNKGVADRSLLQATIGLARKAGKPVIVDPKGMDFSKYRRATMVCPNKSEAERAVNGEIANEQDLVRIGQTLLSELESEAVLVTLGGQGMCLFETEGRHAHIPAVAQEVYDVTGAGDTVVATLALALATAAKPLEATYLANYAAGIVVGKVGTATVAVRELLSAIE